MQKVLLVLFFLVFSPHAFAANVCPKGNLVQDYSFPEGFAINCNFLLDVERYLSDASDLAQIRLPMLIDLMPEGSAAYFDLGATLKVYQRLVLYDRYDNAHYRDSIDNLSVVVHEYGHALFEEELRRGIAPYVPYSNFLRQNSRERFTLQRDFEQQRRSIERLPLTKKQQDQALAPIKERLAANFKAQTEHLQIPSNRLLLSTAAPFHELYADVVAVYKSDNKSAIANSLWRDDFHSDEERNMVGARSFEPDIPFRIHPNIAADPHPYFYRVRRFIGKDLWPKNPTQKRLYLRKITDAIIEQVRENLYATNGLKQNPEQQNDRLIAKIKARL